MFKLSKFVVITSPFEENDKKIVYSTRSGKDLLISNYVVKCIQDGNFEFLPKETIDKLFLYNILVDSNSDELLEIINENNQFIEGIDSNLLYEVIQPSAMCQMGCYYCGQVHTKNYISQDIANKIIDRIESKLLKGNYNKLYIGWFGGEPLLGLPQMRELSSKLLTLANKYNVSYSAKLITNGLILKKNIFLELVNEMVIDHVELTIDGLNNDHNSHRPLKNGRATFDLVFKNMIEICSVKQLKNKCKISVRCNVDSNNYLGVIPLIRKISEYNLQNKITFYPIGVYSWGNDAHLKSLTKEEFAKWEILWLIELIKNKFPINFLRPRVKQVCLALSKNSEVYDSFGNIFNCTEIPYVSKYNESDYVLGSFFNSSIVNDRKFKNWNEEVLTDSSIPCHTCNMLPVCGGACPKSWHEDMRACPSSKFNIKERLKLKHLVLSANNENEFNASIKKHY